QTQRLVNNFKKALDHVRLHLTHLSSRLVDPREKIKLLQNNFKQMKEKLFQTMKTQLLFSRKTIENRIQMLHSLSPLQVLARGFSLTSDTKHTIIRSVNELKPGTKIITRLADGSVTSEVISE
ncbi:MAG: hypothetical protein EB120_10880, partial [Proteobacteria bacterium]|nr:hypothetical protein [Pseudomonadota bacterium]